MPCNAVISEYVKAFGDDERYYPADKAIDKLIASFPQNSKIEDVLLKVTVINRLYSTEVYDINKMARHILSKNIDSELKLGNLSIVNLIASGHGIISSKNKKEVRCYSFANKYCNWHRKDVYPIYDSFVDKILCAYLTTASPCQASRQSLHAPFTQMVSYRLAQQRKRQLRF